MSWRFRRNVKICKGVRLNLNKSGPGISIGGKGFHVGTGPRGNYVSAGIPGTGLYSMNYLKSKQKGSGSPQSVPQSSEQLKNKNIWLSILLFSASLIALIAYWPVGLVLLAGTIVWQFARPKASNDQAIPEQKVFEEDDHTGALEAVSDVKPEPPTSLQVADSESEQCHFAEAVASYEKYLATGASNPFVKLRYAVALTNDKQHEKAIGILQGLPAELKQELPTINALAICFLETGQLQAALEVLKEGPTRRRTMDDQMVTFRYLLGTAYEKLGDKKKAIAQFSKVVAADEHFLDAKEMLEQLNDRPKGVVGSNDPL